MKYVVWIMALVMVVPVPARDSAAASHGDRVEIDFSMVEAGIDWLKLVRSGAPDDVMKETFMKKVVPTAGCQAIIQHWARFMEWDAETLYAFILEALDPKPDPEKLRANDGTETFFGLRHRLWQGALKDNDALRSDLETLKKEDLSRSLAIARSFLPPQAVLDVRFSFVLFGHSTAFSVGRENGFDFLQLPRLANGTLDLKEIVLTFAHELHHSGFVEPDMAEPERAVLLGILAAEGMPTFFIDEIGRRLEEYKASTEEMDRMVAADWVKHTTDLPALYEKAAADLLANFEKKIGQKEIMEFWMAGAKGPAYVLGSELIATIDKHLGRESAVSVAADYRNLITLYNRAARKANEAGEKKLVFSEELEKKLSAL